MTHYAPEIAASNVVEIRQPLPVTQAHPRAAASIDRGGASPINPFIFPSNPPRDRRDALLVVLYSLIFAVPLAGVTIVIHVFR